MDPPFSEVSHVFGVEVAYLSQTDGCGGQPSGAGLRVRYAQLRPLAGSWFYGGNLSFGATLGEADACDGSFDRRSEFADFLGFELLLGLESGGLRLSGFAGAGLGLEWVSIVMGLRAALSPGPSTPADGPPSQ